MLHVCSSPTNWAYLGVHDPAWWTQDCRKKLNSIEFLPKPTPKDLVYWTLLNPPALKKKRPPLVENGSFFSFNRSCCPRVAERHAEATRRLSSLRDGRPVSVEDLHTPTPRQTTTSGACPRLPTMDGNDEDSALHCRQVHLPSSFSFTFMDVSCFYLR